MTALELKRFFKRQFGIPVLAEGAAKPHHYAAARIKPNPPKRFHDPITYPYQFSPVFGNQCMRIVYAGDPELSKQSWGGNISPHSIAMFPKEWEQLIALYEPKEKQNATDATVSQVS